jgi:hypothetical protein
MLVFFFWAALCAGLVVVIGTVVGKLARNRERL